MATKLDDLYVDLQVRNANLAVQQVDRVSTAMSGLKSYAKATAVNIGGVFAATGVAAVATGTVKAAAELERSQLLLKRFVDSDFNNLADGINRMSTDLPISVHGLYEIASGAAQVGVEGTKNLLAFTDVVGKLATVSDMSFNDTAKSMAKLLNVYRLGPGGVKPAANVIAGMSAASAADPGELITLTQRLSGAATNIGMTLEETIALSAALKDVGGSSEVAGTAFSTMINDMARMPGEFAKALGMTEKEFKKLRDENPVEAIIAAIKKIEEQPTVDDRIAVATMLGAEGARQSGILLQMVQGLDKFQSHLKLARGFSKDGTILDKQFATQADGTIATLTKLGNAFVLLDAKMEGLTLKVIKGWANVGINAINAVVRPWDDEGKLTPEQQRKLMEAANRHLKKQEDDEDSVHRMRMKKADITVADAKKAEQEAAAQLDKDVASQRAAAAAFRGAPATDNAQQLKQWNDASDKARDSGRTWRATAAALTAAFAGQKKATDDWEKVLQGRNARDQKQKDEAAKAALRNAEDGAVVQQARRGFALDKLMDPQQTNAFRAAVAMIPDAIGGEAKKALLAKMKDPKDPLKLTEDEVGALAKRQMGAKQDLIGQLVGAGMNRLNMKPIFGDADSMWKRISSGGDQMDVKKLLEQNKKQVEIQTKATQSVEAAIKEQTAVFKDGVLVLAGE